MKLCDGLAIAMFTLMGCGLLLASWFLSEGLITGDNWVTVCTVLFGVDRISQAITSGVQNRATRP